VWQKQNFPMRYVLVFSKLVLLNLFSALLATCQCHKYYTLSCLCWWSFWPPSTDTTLCLFYLVYSLLFDFLCLIFLFVSTWFCFVTCFGHWILSHLIYLWFWFALHCLNIKFGTSSCDLIMYSKLIWIFKSYIWIFQDPL
jgi:hypothetical protein